MQTKRNLCKKLLATTVMTAIFCGYLEAKLTQDVRKQLQKMVPRPLLDPPLIYAASPVAADLSRCNVHLANLLVHAAFSPLAFAAAGAPAAGALKQTRMLIDNFIRNGIDNNGDLIVAAPVSELVIGNGYAPAQIGQVVGELRRGFHLGAGIPADAVIQGTPINPVDNALLAAAKLIVAAGKAAEAAIHHNGGIPPAKLSHAALPAYKVTMAMAAKPPLFELNKHNNTDIESRKVIFSFLGMNGIIGGNAGPHAVPAIPAGALAPPVAAVANDQANHLWEHLMDRAHLWQIPTVIASSHFPDKEKKSELHYLAWSRAARIRGGAPSVHTSFVVPTGTNQPNDFKDHFERLLSTVEVAGDMHHLDVSWNNSVNGIAPNIAGFNASVTVPGAAVPMVTRTESIASAGRGIVYIHINIGDQPRVGKVLKVALLGAIGGTIIIPHPDDPALEAATTRRIVDDITGNMNDGHVLPIGPVAWITENQRAQTAPEPFLPLIGENRPANCSNGLAPRNITIVVGGTGEVNTMFTE